MADHAPHLATSPNGLEGVITPYYFCLEGQQYGPGMKPGRTWRLTDKSNGVTCTCKSSIPSENELHVRIEATDRQPIEHVFSRDYNTDSLALKLKTSLFDGVTYTWGSGLQIPSAWFLGEEIESVSRENEPSTRGPLKFSAEFLRFIGDKIPIPGDETGEKKAVIQIEETISSVKTGLKIAEIRLYFGLGVGIIGAEGRIWERYFKYRLQDFSDN